MVRRAALVTVLSILLLLAGACAEPTSERPGADGAAAPGPAPGVVASADQAPAEDEPPELVADPALASPAPYGSPPEGAAPFAQYGDPSKRFFIDPLRNKGAGQDKPEPEGLTSVKIGLLAPIEHPRDGIYGRATVNAAKLVVDRFNAAGGYKGIPFELLVRNDNGLWGASANEIARFAYDDGAWLFIGTIDGSNSHVALRVTLKAEMPMVNVSSTDPTVTETSIPWLLRVMVDDRAQAYALAEHVFRERGLKRVVTLRGNERYGRLGIKEFRDTARRLGHPVLMERNIPAGTTDFEEPLDVAERYRPDAFVLWLDPWETAGVVKAIRARGWDQPIFGSSRAVRPEFLELAGADAEGFTGVTSFDPTSSDEGIQAFIAAYREAYGTAPDDFAATAWDGVTIALQAVLAAGLNRARIMDELSKVRVWKGALGEGRLNETLNAEGPVHLAVVRDGRFEYRKVR